jgi:bacteriorhodopsin
MHHGEGMGDGLGVDKHERASTAGFLSPAVSAVAAFTLAVAALLGQNAVSVGVGSVLESEFAQGKDAFYVGWGLAVAIQVGLVWLLARRSMEAPGGWESVLGRAAFVLSFVALAAGVLVVVGGLLST